MHLTVRVPPFLPSSCKGFPSVQMPRNRSAAAWSVSSFFAKQNRRTRGRLLSMQERRRRDGRDAVLAGETDREVGVSFL